MGHIVVKSKIEIITEQSVAIYACYKVIFVCILNLYSDPILCMSLTIHYYVLPYNPIAFKSVVLFF